MSLRARLRHTVTIERSTAGARNEYGIKTPLWASLRTVKGWVQPTSRQEVTEDTEGGALRATYRLFLLPTDLRESDRILWNGEQYRITQVLNPAGKDHHLEVSLVKSEVLP